MRRRRRATRRDPRAAALGLMFLGAIGCAARRSPIVQADPLLDAATPAVATAPRHDDLGISSPTDRAKLELLARTRAHAAVESGYRIGPDDLLEIRIPDLLEVAGPQTIGRPTAGPAALPQVADAPAYQQGSRVDAIGDITLPLLGSVPVAGRTPAELERQLADRLRSAGILRSPQVTVQVAEYRSRVVAVVGSVERPGLYPVTRPGMTLAEVVLAAGGPSKDAGRVVAFVPAPETAVGPPSLNAPVPGSAIRLDLEALLHPPDALAHVLNPRILPGDVVSLAPAGNVMVDGWVEKPGSYPATRGLTLSGAVAAAGGELYPADRRQVAVKRALGADAERFYVVDLDAVAHGEAPDLVLADGDVVRISASSTRLLPWGFWQLAREMIHIGGSVALF